MKLTSKKEDSHRSKTLSIASTVVKTGEINTAKVAHITWMLGSRNDRLNEAMKSIMKR